MKRTRPAILCCLFLAACLVLAIMPVAAQQIQTDPQVSYEAKHDVSLPLSYLARIAPKSKHGFVEMLSLIHI